MCIGKFCNRHVVCASRDTTIVKGAHLMRRNQFGDVIVVDARDEGWRPTGNDRPGTRRRDHLRGQGERNHQGLENRLLKTINRVRGPNGIIRTREARRYAELLLSLRGLSVPD